MKPYLAQIRMNLRLTRRDRMALFFQFIFPLVFFFMFSSIMHAEQGGASQVVTMVLTIGVLGSGLFGAGLRAVSEREQNILRRFKVAPISPGPILVSSLVTGLIQFIPLVVLVLFMAHAFYGMPYPQRMGSLVLFVGIGVVAFRSIGSMVAAVVNSMQESQIVTQLLYFPMLFLGGATFPLSIMPNWLQSASQFVPTTHLTTGMQGIMRGRDGLLEKGNLTAALALLTTAAIATFLAMKLFRWEKEEKLKPTAKLWLVAVLAPVFGMGVWQAQAKDNLVKNKIEERDLRRSRTFLIRDARLFLGDGQVIDRGSVLVKDGKIAEVFTGAAPDPKALKADPVDAAGKTLLPGLIDVHVHLGSPGGFYEKQDDYQKVTRNIDRELAAYLYSGVIAVKSTGDALDEGLKDRAVVNSGEKLGAELFLVGPMFTAKGGHGTEYTRYVPEQYRAMLEQQLVRLPQSADEARTQVAELKQKNVNGIKAILEAGGGNTHYNRMDSAIFRAVVEAARASGLPVVAHVGDSQDVADAVDAHVDGIEHGSFRDATPDATFVRMKEMGIAYDPTLLVYDTLIRIGKNDSTPLDRSLVVQTAPPSLIQASKSMLGSDKLKPLRDAYAKFPMNMDFGKKNLRAAYRAGVMLTAGTDAGNPLVTHGPGIHREMQLWVEAGLTPATALQAATYNNAKLLRVDNRLGLIKKGYDASLLLIDGNPLQDISATEHISMVVYKGERVNRSELFDDDSN
jgi:imidazolonepropionase-like amidohydrolase/ABC-type multidrug transport system permease subunit